MVKLLDVIWILFMLVTVVNASDFGTESADVTEGAEFVLDVRKHIESCSPLMTLPTTDSCNVKPKLSLDGDHISFTFKDLCSCLTLLRREAKLTSKTTSTKVDYKRDLTMEISGDRMRIKTNASLEATDSTSVTESSLLVTDVTTDSEEGAIESVILPRTMPAEEKMEITPEPEERYETSTSDFVIEKERPVKIPSKLPYIDSESEKNATVSSDHEDHEETPMSITIVSNVSLLIPAEYKGVSETTEPLKAIESGDETSSIILSTLIEFENVTRPVVFPPKPEVLTSSEAETKTESKTFRSAPVEEDITLRSRPKDPDSWETINSTGYVVTIGNVTTLAPILSITETDDKNDSLIFISERKSSEGELLTTLLTSTRTKLSKEDFYDDIMIPDDRTSISPLGFEPPLATSSNSNVSKTNAYVLLIMALSLALLMFWISCLLCKLFKKRGSYSVPPCNVNVEIGDIYKSGHLPS